jgi:hypothetical protein
LIASESILSSPGGAAQVTAQPGPSLQRADKLIPAAGAPLVATGDETLQVVDEVGPHPGVPGGLIGVVADDKPLRPHALVAVAVAAGSHVDFLDPQVVGDGLVAAGTGQRRGGLSVGAAQLLGVDGPVKWVDGPVKWIALRALNPSMTTRSATQPVAASFEPGSSARCATSVKSTRSTASPSSWRPSAARRIAAPMPRRSQSRSNVHAPPSRQESTISTYVPAAAATAWSGSRNREIEATSRPRASRSTLSARPKLWITFATGLPVRGCRSLCASAR